MISIKSTLPSFNYFNPTVSSSSFPTGAEDQLSEEIRWLEELSAQEALQLKHAARMQKTTSPLTPHQTIIDLAG